MSETRWMTVEQLMRYLQVSRTTLYQWMQDGRLPYRELPAGRGRRFDRAEVDHLLTEPTPSGEALTEAIRTLHREMNARWDAGNDEYRQVIHLLRAAASGESLAAAGVDRWLRMAEASNPAGTNDGWSIREAARLLRARLAEVETVIQPLVPRLPQQKSVCTVELAFTYEPNSLTAVRDRLRATKVPNHPDVEASYVDPSPGKIGTYKLQFDFRAASAAEVDDVARSYVDRVVTQLDSYGPRVVTQCSCFTTTEP